MLVCLLVYFLTSVMSSEYDGSADDIDEAGEESGADEISLDGDVYAIETDHYRPPNDDDAGYDSETDGFYQVGGDSVASVAASRQPSRQTSRQSLAVPSGLPSRRGSPQSLAAPPSQSISRKNSQASLNQPSPSSSFSASPLPQSQAASHTPSPVPSRSSEKRKASDEQGPPRRYRQPWLPPYVKFDYYFLLLSSLSNF